MKLSLPMIIFIAVLTAKIGNAQIFFPNNNVNNNNNNQQQQLPIVVTTWWNSGYEASTNKAFDTVVRTGDQALALVEGCTVCETQCGGSVGPNGSPDESGETTLDALVMDGPGHQVGAVGGLRRIADASKVAYAVLKHTRHSVLVGDQATQFAKQLGFQERNISGGTAASQSFRQRNCQGNFWKDVSPNPTVSCGPYSALNNPTIPSSAINNNNNNNNNNGYTFTGRRRKRQNGVVAEGKEGAGEPGTEGNHDTVGMVVVDQNGDIAAGTSTNGLTFKIPGRMGDCPIPGAGAYVDNEVGGAAATGNGDIMLRFLPTYQTVEFMRQGLTPQEAAAQALQRIARVYPNFNGAIIAVNKQGVYGAACHRMGQFPYAVRSGPASSGSTRMTVNCT